MCDETIQQMFRAVVITKVCYASSTAHGGDSHQPSTPEVFSPTSDAQPSVSRRISGRVAACCMQQTTHCSGESSLMTVTFCQVFCRQVRQSLQSAQETP